MTAKNKILSKNDLVNFQREFKKIITRPLTNNDLMRNVQKISFGVPDKKNISSKRQLEIYAQQYWWRIEAAFDEDFTTVRTILTAKKFESLREEYLIKCPSQSYTLRNLGQFFVGFISKSKTLTKNQKALVRSAAMFDWSRVVAFDALSLQPISKEALKVPSFIAKKLTLQPHVQLLELDYPAQKINIARNRADLQSLSNVITKQNSPDISKTKSRVKNIRPLKTFLAVHRYQEKIFIKELDSLEYQVLKLVKNGISLQLLSKNSLMKKIPSSDWFLKHWNDWASLEWICLKKN
jgi:hypothetical protein